MGRIRINRIIAPLLLAAVLTGCAFGESGDNAGELAKETESREKAKEQGTQDKGGSSAGGGEEDPAGSMEAEPDLSYEVPESVPGIWVNRLGYIREGEKTAVFCGRELPEEFYVVEEESGEVVFAGYLKGKGYNEGQEEYNGYGDFSEVQENGTYYIEAPVLGRSYSFTIGEDLYGDVFRAICRQYGRRWQEGEMPEGAPDQKVTEAAGEIAVMLLAYELNSGSFTDDTGILESGNGIPDLLDAIRYEVEWLLKMQEEETGAVYAGAVPEDQDGKGQEEAFAMALAKFSYLYQEYDTDFATECLKAADRAWQYADLAEGEKADAEGTKKSEWKFAAAAELYRASGKQSYHACVSEYLSGGSYRDKMDLPVFAGCATYISTRQTVDLTFCEEITRELTIRAEKAAERMEDILCGDQKSMTKADGQRLLEESMYLILINHMITSREYTLLAENSLHYLMGRNAQSVSYINGTGENNDQPEDDGQGVLSWPEGSSRMILLLSDILNWQAEHEGDTR